jgi:prophage antirepressor-like protein
MHPLATYTHDFEGAALVTLTYDGKPAWVARDIAALLGYSHGGKRLPNKILGDWKDEFIEGKDYAFLTGEELALLKATSPEVSPNANRSLLILFESGLWMVLVKTRRAVGKRLRRFLVEDVLPQIGRTGAYSPDRQVVGGVVVSLELARPVEGLASRRESRLTRQAATRERWVDLCDRKHKVGALHRVIDRATVLPDDVVAALEISAAEIALGADLGALKPETERWVTPSQIARRWGLSPQKVGRVISGLGLRGDERFSKRVLSKAKHVDRVVVTFLYNAAGEALIDAVLGGGDDDTDDAA